MARGWTEADVRAIQRRMGKPYAPPPPRKPPLGETLEVGGHLFRWQGRGYFCGCGWWLGGWGGDGTGNNKVEEVWV